MSQHPTEELTPDMAAVLLDAGPSPEILIERRLDQAQLQAIFVELRSRTAELNYRIVVMRLIERRSLAQIAVAVRLSEPCVKMRLSRSLKKLRALLRAEAGSDSLEELKNS